MDKRQDFQLFLQFLPDSSPQFILSILYPTGTIFKNLVDNNYLFFDRYGPSQIISDAEFSGENSEKILKELRNKYSKVGSYNAYEQRPIECLLFKYSDETGNKLECSDISQLSATKTQTFAPKISPINDQEYHFYPQLKEISENKRQDLFSIPMKRMNDNSFFCHLDYNLIVYEQENEK